MSDDELYYEDDDYYNDDAGDAVEEHPIESLYMDAKTIRVVDMDKSIPLFEKVVEDDTSKGEFTYRAYKQLSRCHQIKKNYPEMISFFSHFIGFRTPSIPMEKVEQDIINVLQFNQTIPVEHLRSLLDLTVKMTSADRPSFPRAWSQATLQLVELDLGVNQYTNAESVLNDVERFLESTAFEERDSLTGVVLLLKMKLYFQTGSYDLLRLLYFRLAGQPQVLPQRRLSEAMQIAGHLFMHDGDWTAAHRAFMFAFLNDRSSGQRALRLKYTIIASILTGSLVDMFADNEVRLFLRDEQVRVCSLLMECFQRRDAIGFAKAINDNASVFKDDANTNPYIVALLRKSRVEALREYTSSFTRISFPSIARHIGVDEKGVEELCRYALINGLIAGRIDSLTPSLTLFDSRQTSENARLAALNKWADALKV